MAHKWFKQILRFFEFTGYIFFTRIEDENLILFLIKNHTKLIKKGLIQLCGNKQLNKTFYERELIDFCPATPQRAR